jgi:Membrane carboxypeptidase/penicillin-binding protein
MTILRLFLLLLQFAFLFIGIIYLIFSRDLPKIETITEIKLTNPMRIYAADGQLLGLFGTEKRQIVKFNEIPDNLKNAIIAAEDGDFFEHSGVEITSLIRALKGGFSGRSLGGGAFKGCK